MSEKKETQEPEIKPTKKFPTQNYWMFSTIILAVLLIAVLLTRSGGNAIGANDAGQKLIDFANEQGANSQLIDIQDDGSLYLITLSIDGEEVPIHITKDGKYLAQVIPLDMPTQKIQTPQPTTNENKIEDSTFLDTGDNICNDQTGKPYVLLFSTTWCPHCKWIEDTFNGLKDDFAGKINIQHWELDTGDNTLTEKIETEIPQEFITLYEKYNPKGSIPTFVFGCKYKRIGNGYEQQNDLNAELNDFKLIINKLLNNENF